MSINLKNFVNVNINYINNTIDEMDFSIVTLIWFRVNNNKDSQDQYLTVINEGTYTNYDDAVENVTDAGFDNFATYFFKNGGKALKVIDADYSIIDTSRDITEVFTEIVQSRCTASNEIIITSNLSANYGYDIAPAIPELPMDADAPDGFKFDGKDSKLLIFTADKDSYIGDTGYNNLICKVGFYVDVESEGTDYNILDGSCMATAAYLSKINFNNANEINDYMYTEEYEPDYVKEYFEENGSYSQSEYDSLKEAHLNCNDEVANKYVNLGGDATDGSDLVNNFALIALENLLTNALYNLIIKKLKYNTTSLSRVRDEISQILDQFVQNGYITSDSSWIDEDVIIDDLIIVSKGSRLQNGYVVYIAEMTSELRDAHKLPNVYIVLNDSTGIRYINVVGKVN